MSCDMHIPQTSYVQLTNSRRPSNSHIKRNQGWVQILILKRHRHAQNLCSFYLSFLRLGFRVIWTKTLFSCDVDVVEDKRQNSSWAGCCTNRKKVTKEKRRNNDKYEYIDIFKFWCLRYAGIKIEHLKSLKHVRHVYVQRFCYFKTSWKRSLGFNIQETFAIGQLLQKSCSLLCPQADAYDMKANIKTLWNILEITLNIR